MKKIKRFVSNLVTNSEYDIDEVYTMTYDRFIDEFSEEEIQRAFEQALDEIPDLN